MKPRVSEPSRYENELQIYTDAMAHELRQNSHKGSWKDCTPEELVEELVYHAAKLALAVEDWRRTGAEIARDALLEYAADCGNLAMMVADVAEALSGDYLTIGAVEYLGIGVPWRERRDEARAYTRWFTERFLRLPTPRERQVRAAQDLFDEQGELREPTPEERREVLGGLFTPTVNQP